jgi:Carbohydrate phosphorylase
LAFRPALLHNQLQRRLDHLKLFGAVVARVKLGLFRALLVGVEVDRLDAGAVQYCYAAHASNSLVLRFKRKPNQLLHCCRRCLARDPPSLVVKPNHLSPAGFSLRPPERLVPRLHDREMLCAVAGHRCAVPHIHAANYHSIAVRASLGGDRFDGAEPAPRAVELRVWQALVGRVRLYLLDANDAFNSAADRGITGKLYDAGSEIRILQEVVLGVAGWRTVERLHPEVEICHLNEGHAAFAVLERVRAAMRRSGLSFWEALWATRAGNLFTTHTPVAAGLDRFPPALFAKYGRYLEDFLAEAGISLEELIGLGRIGPDDGSEPFNMAYLAIRGSMQSCGVSRLHAHVSRRLFQALFPRWPEREVPVGHVTNGVHVPSWDSPHADHLCADSGNVARSFRDHVARCSDMMSPG